MDEAPPDAPAARPIRSFAVLRDGALRPLDPLDAEDGVIYLVTLERAEHVPAQPLLRRLAASAIDGLPRDLADRHDRYATAYRQATDGRGLGRDAGSFDVLDDFDKPLPDDVLRELESP